MLVIVLFSLLRSSRKAFLVTDPYARTRQAVDLGVVVSLHERSGSELAASIRASNRLYIVHLLLLSAPPLVECIEVALTLPCYSSLHEKADHVSSAIQVISQELMLLAWSDIH